MTVRILVGDCRVRLAELPEKSVQMCVTSPPYWGLRDYGTAVWEGGDPECKHLRATGGTKSSGLHAPHFGNGLTDATVASKIERSFVPHRSVCKTCGAVRLDKQIGLEESPDVFVAQMVDVFRQVHRVLKDDGTLWLNLGDSYASAWVCNRRSRVGAGSMENGKRDGRPNRLVGGLKEKDLVGMPWRVALALQADGWYLRSDIIWHKPNPMPESINDRPTKAHEYVFLFAKSERYLYDADAIREPATGNAKPRVAVKSPAGWDRTTGNGAHGNFVRDGRDPGVTPKAAMNEPGSRQNSSFQAATSANVLESRNARTVWTVPTSPFKDAHFATFPPALIEPCVLAGSRGAGKRCDCDEVIATPVGSGGTDDPTMETGRAGMNRQRNADEGSRPITRRQQRHHAVELRASPHRAEMETEAGDAFAHYLRTDRSGARPVPPDLLDRWRGIGWLTDAAPCDHTADGPDVVLDPFGGAGTTGLVAARHGRDAILIELNPEYAAMAESRIHRDQPLFADVVRV